MEGIVLFSEHQYANCYTYFRNILIYNKRLSKLELSYGSQLFAVYNGFIRVAVDDSVNV